MSNRKDVRISDAIGTLLHKQIAQELKNYTLYVSFANLCALKGFDDLAFYWNKRSEEEKLHHDWIKEYLADSDYRLMYPGSEYDKAQETDSIIETFKRSVDREIETTDMLYKIREAAFAEKDFMTVTWLDEYLIKEQREEEDTSRTALGIMMVDADPYVKAERVLELLEW